MELFVQNLHGVDPDQTAPLLRIICPNTLKLLRYKVKANVFLLAWCGQYIRMTKRNN